MPCPELICLIKPVPDSALLYAAPSNAHTETILVRNAGTEAVTEVYVSHRDRVGNSDAVRRLKSTRI